MAEKSCLDRFSRNIMIRLRLVLGCFLVSATTVRTTAAEATGEGGARRAPTVNYALEVRPILSANCFACHGRDDETRQADLRLDQRAAAVDFGAIVPGNGQASLLIERIRATDPKLRMPPADSGQRLSDDQIRTLQKWITEGAEYTEHWSFVPPSRPAPPLVAASDWPANGIDSFVLQRLEQSGMRPAPQADPYGLVRRLFLDLTGLPPSPETVDDFAASATKEAYERLVDHLLASPGFGEHWAGVWLDLARYADTKGYEKDFPRDMWPYRDWVIRALNDDKPYDQFTIEQLAGDLLPNPSRDQLIATAFHRNTMSNDEGGTDDEEFRVAAVKDRVDTTMQVWMGLTAGCAKCHSHKYDPISQKEYYELFAIFNQTADADAFDDSPVMRFDALGQRAQLESLRKSAADIQRAGDGKDRASVIEQQIKDVEGGVTKLPIMRERSKEQHRASKIHVRGNFLDQGEEVSPSVPAAFGRLASGAPHNRLELARWLVSHENPLTPRVIANRVWARFFGIGLVETEGDFGSQGSPPSHPLLLDWLATEMRDTHRWSLKKLCRTIVMSATYQQSSVADPAKANEDPRNRLLCRGALFRLPAETVRDQALAASGLLSKKMYGPPVMPPQPEGVWKSIYNSRKWQTSSGADRYRRAIYTYWKRTSPYPSMLIFDAESREVCAVRRLATNTPLQALVLMNDPVYLEAAAALAGRMIREGGSRVNDRISRGFRLLLIRRPSSSELQRLAELRAGAEKSFEIGRSAATEFLRACNATPPTDSSLAPAEYASYVVVASVLLNLDELVTRN
jgi:hypothetical protein